MYLHHCRCFQEHVRMLLQSLRSLSTAPVGARSIWYCLDVLVRATGVSGRFAYGFWTELHFADVSNVTHCKNKRHGIIAAPGAVCNVNCRVWFTFREYEVLSDLSETFGIPGVRGESGVTGSSGSGFDRRKLVAVECSLSPLWQSRFAGSKLLVVDPASLGASWKRCNRLRW